MMEDVSTVVKGNTRAVEEMNNNSEQVTRAINNIVAVSEDTNKAVRHVNTAAREMNTQVREVTNLAGALNEMAQSQQALLAQFQLDESRPTSVDRGLVGDDSQRDSDSAQFQEQGAHVRELAPDFR